MADPETGLPADLQQAPPAPGSTGAADPLAGLRDIELPPPPGWWPPAPGWWLLAAAIVLLGLVLFRRWQRWYAARRPWRAARATLARLEQRACADEDPRVLGEELSDLLRRYALVRWPRTQIARLSGERWLGFLAETGAPTLAADASGLLTQQRYERPNPASTPAQPDIIEAITAARAWVDLHRPSGRRARAGDVAGWTGPGVAAN